MTVGELLAALNEHAKERALPSPSKRALQDWIQEGLIPNANGRGRGRSRGIEWQYDEEALRHGCALIDLKEFGRLRFDKARIFLWIKGFQIPADEARQSLANEFDLLVKRLLRASRVDFDARSGRVLSPVESQSHSRRLGPLDPQLRSSGFVIGDELLMELVSELVFGGDKHEQKPPPNEAANLLRRLGASSLFGDVQEVAQSGAETLKSIANADLNMARVAFTSVERAMDEVIGILISNQDDTITPALKKVRLSLSHPDWMVSFVAAFAILEHKSRLISELRRTFA